MKFLQKSLAVLMLGGISTAAWFGATSLVQNVQFARAEEKVESSRQQLQGVQDLSNVYRQVSKVVEPSVVKIDVKKSVKGVHRGLNMDPDLLKKFFPDLDGDGEPDMPGEDGEGMLQMGEGSGVIMEAADGVGYILTNNHVAGGASELSVTLADGREIEGAKLVGADPKSDLAVVKISADRLIAAKWGNSDYLEKGDIILAFGAPFGYVGSMTHGIVSALNRTNVGILDRQVGYENFIQVDAPINPGNSGGPLVNLRGEVVGINTAIASRTGAFNGIGFAIPSNMAKPVYAQLKDKGKVVRGWLGVEISNVNEARVRDMVKSTGYTGDTGVLVVGVMNDTPAAGKLQPGDVVTEIDGKKVEGVTQLRNLVAATAPNTEARFTVFREGKSQDITVKIGEQPDDLLARASERRGGGRRGETGGAASADAMGLRLTTPTEQQLQRFNLGDAQGALITAIEPNSPAAMAGLGVGDLITKVGDKPVNSSQEAVDELAKQDLSKGVKLFVTNKDGERFVFVKSKK